MGNENGTWVMHGISAKTPGCIHDFDELLAFVNRVGFVPLFKNQVDGFSVEEHTESKFWWSKDRKRDPWEWRELAARSGKVVYGKFFDKKAGFISKEWLPYFINYRRNGYDFDALWDDEKASARQKRIMDLFLDAPELFSNEIKALAGFGKEGEKNFEGILTSLQMELYLCVTDFRQRKNRKGESYGWPIAVYAKPENLWGYESVTVAYKESPEASKERILSHMRKLYPGAEKKQISKVVL